MLTSSRASPRVKSHPPCNLLTLPIEPFFFGEFSVQVVVSLQTNPRITGVFFPVPKKGAVVVETAVPTGIR